MSIKTLYLAGLVAWTFSVVYLLILLMTEPASADWSVKVKQHCIEENVVAKKDGEYKLTGETEIVCTSTPNDWKDDSSS